jgi:hypothetical protein
MSSTKIFNKSRSCVETLQCNTKGCSRDYFIKDAYLFKGKMTMHTLEFDYKVAQWHIRRIFWL